MLANLIAVASGTLLVIYLIVKPLFDYLRDVKGLCRFHAFSPLAGMTNIPYMLATTRRRRYKIVHDAHQRHEILRVGPNAISFNNIEAAKTIYGFGTKALKDDFYRIRAGTHRQLANCQDVNEHARKRKMLGPAYAQAALAQWSEMVAERTAALIRQYDDRCAGSGVGIGDEKERRRACEVVNHRRWMNLFTIDVISETGLSANLHLLEAGNDLVHVETMTGKTYQANFRQSLWNMFRIQSCFAFSNEWYLALKKLTWWHPFWKDEKAFEEIVLTLCRRRLARYQAGEKLLDIFSFLMEDKNGEANMLPMGEIVAECAIMMNAGSDTTAIALTNVLYNLIKNPACLATLRQELDTALGADVTVAPYEVVKHLPYLRACLDESLRLCPPNTMSIPRKTPPEGLQILGEWIPGDTTVHCPTYTLHRNEEVFPDANSFIPERWLQNDVRDMQESFFTFSSGARGCVGRGLTYLEQTVVVASLVHRYEFELPSEDWVLPQYETFTCSPGDMPLLLRSRGAESRRQGQPKDSSSLN